MEQIEQRSHLSSEWVIFQVENIAEISFYPHPAKMVLSLKEKKKTEPCPPRWTFTLKFVCVLFLIFCHDGIFKDVY